MDSKLQPLPQTAPFDRIRIVSGRYVKCERSTECPFSRGTGSSNPSPSSRESTNFRFLNASRDRETETRCSPSQQPGLLPGRCGLSRRLHSGPAAPFIPHRQPVSQVTRVPRVFSRPRKAPLITSVHHCSRLRLTGRASLNGQCRPVWRSSA
jgi:hypothetical protein